MPDVNATLPLPTDPSNNEGQNKKSANDAALTLIRSKLNQIYGEEPDVVAEEDEIKDTGAHSAHQSFIKNLMDSGKSQEHIQSEWHAYYQKLPDDEKRKVWDEFYAHSAQTTPTPITSSKPSRATLAGSKKTIQPLPKKSEPADTTHQTTPKIIGDSSRQLTAFASPVLGDTEYDATQYEPLPNPKKSYESSKEELIQKISAHGKLKPKHHIQSLLFGLSMGTLVMAVLMFSFFNERIIAPFIRPSLSASSSPIIIDPTEKVSKDPKIIIPKINVEIPVIYGLENNSEELFQDALEEGVVHYPNTPHPGENGNVVVFGHSSHNLLNPGKYKYAFVLLSYLQNGDTVIMHYKGTKYVYKVYDSFVVAPTQVEVLGPTDNKATITLITCTPVGTNAKRLIVRAEQVLPATNSNVASQSKPISVDDSTIVPGNSQSLFSRLFSWL